MKWWYVGQRRKGGTLAVVGLALVAHAGCTAWRGYTPELTDRAFPVDLQDHVAPGRAGFRLDPRGSEGQADEPTGARRTSLDQAIEVAREHASRVLEAAANLEVASGRVQSADGALLPGIDVQVGGRFLDGREVGSFGELGDDLSFGRFEPSAGIFYRVNPGAALTRAARFRREADAASFDLREAQRTAMLQAGIAYLDLLLSHASHQIAERLVRDAERFVAITRARAQAEIGAGADVARAETEAARARQVALRTRGRWEEASVRLAVLLRWNTAERLLPDESELHAVSLIDVMARSSLNEEAELARPDIRAADARSKAAARELMATWWDLLGPNIDVTLRERLIGTEVDDVENTHLVHGLAGFRFDFAKLGRVRTARGNAHVAEIREQAAREEARGEIEAAVSKVQTASATIPEAQSAVDAAERNYAIQLARFEAGTGLGIEVIEAQNALARARLELAEAIVRNNAAQIELAASIGHLTSDLLASRQEQSWDRRGETIP